MKKKVVRLVLVMISFICLTACAQKDLAVEESGETILGESASNAEDISSSEEIDAGSTLPEEAKSENIVRIEGYSRLDEQKDFTIENNKEIEKILGILDQSNEVLKEQKEISNLVESYYLECYKPSVTVIKSEARKLYTLYFYEDSNIVKMKISSDNSSVVSVAIEDVLNIYYEVSNEDLNYINQFFVEK